MRRWVVVLTVALVALLFPQDTRALSITGHMITVESVPRMFSVRMMGGYAGYDPVHHRGIFLGGTGYYSPSTQYSGANFGAWAIDLQSFVATSIPGVTIPTHGLGALGVTSKGMLMWGGSVNSGDGYPSDQLAWYDFRAETVTVFPDGRLRGPMVDLAVGDAWNPVTREMQALGGWSGSYTPWVHRYEPLSRRVTEGPPLPYPVDEPSVAVDPVTGFTYLAGGHAFGEFRGEVWGWRPGGTPVQVGTIPGRDNAAAHVVDGFLYVMGGRDGSPDGGDGLSSIHRIDPLTHETVVAGSLNTGTWATSSIRWQEGSTTKVLILTWYRHDVGSPQLVTFAPVFE